MRTGQRTFFHKRENSVLKPTETRKTGGMSLFPEKTRVQPDITGSQALETIFGVNDLFEPLIQIESPHLNYHYVLFSFRFGEWGRTKREEAGSNGRAS